jgi:3-oxoadipate enol-lactonase
MTTTNDPGTTTHHDFWFESAGARLYAVETGTGHPIVFLHGGLADHRSALFRAGALAASFRLIAPDLRGSGRSVHGGALSWDLLADDVLALLVHLGVERALVGGTSMGAGVALRFGLRYPRLTAGLLLVSPMHQGDELGLTPEQAAAVRAMDDAGRAVLEQGIEALLPLYERLPAALRDRAIDMMRGFDAASVAATTRFLASGTQPFGSIQELAALDVPTLLVPGTDPEHPAEVAARYAEKLPRPTVLDPTSPDLMLSMTRFCAALS